MFGTYAPATRLWIIRGLLAIVVLGLSSAVVRPEEQAVVRVEEDWELVVGQPDVDTNAPQVTCVISPFADANSLHCTFDVNYQSLLEYAAGGLQLQVWEAEVPLIERRAPVDAVLAYPGETIRWTQSMRVHEGWLCFEITNGESTTWGDFGGASYLKAWIWRGVYDLNAYSPDVSVGNSGVGYAANRVTSLTLKRVRRFLADGEVLVDDAPRVIRTDL